MLHLVVIGGLGTMLGPAAKHLRHCQAARVLRVLDRGQPGALRQERRQAWREYGAELVPSLSSLLAANDFAGVLLCAGKNGDDHELIQQMTPLLAPGTFILQLSTVSCDFVQATAAHCAQHRLAYANYPLTGGAVGAANASMLILASGDEALYQRLLPVLSCLGKAKYLGLPSHYGAMTKLLGHVMVYYGLMGMSAATSLHARCLEQSHFTPDQSALFDFLNQGAGGSKQWEVTLRPGLADDNWQRGFLLQHALVDLIYVLQLMLEKRQFPATLPPLFVLAYSFNHILRQEGRASATQVLAQYWLDPEKARGLQEFLRSHYDPRREDHAQLEHCVALLPADLKKSVMLQVRY